MKILSNKKLGVLVVQNKQNKTIGIICLSYQIFLIGPISADLGQSRRVIFAAIFII